MNRKTLLLVFLLGVGTYLLPTTWASSQEAPPPEVTCTSDPDCSAGSPTSWEVDCDPVPNDPSCPNYADYWHGTTETSVFVCSPYPDPACFEGEGLEGPPSEVPEEAQGATDPPARGDAPPAHAERPRTTLPRTGTSLNLTLLGLALVGTGTLTLRLRRGMMGA